eukprot:2302352-Rhodomonas_salina.1
MATEQADRAERENAYVQGVAHQRMREHQLEVGRRVARRVMRTQLAGCFRCYVEGVLMLQLHRRICARVMRRTRVLEASMAVRRWAEAVTDGKHSERIQTRAMRRRRIARMEAAVGAWQAISLFLRSISMFRSRVTRRRALQGLAAMLELWRGSKHARARRKQKRSRVEERRRVLRQAAAFEPWRQRSGTRRRLRRGSQKVAQRMHRFTLSSALQWWRLYTQLSGTLRRASCRIEQRRLNGQATTALHSWRDVASELKTWKRVSRRIEQRRQNVQASTAFNRWRDGAFVHKPRRRKADGGAGQRKQAVTAFNCWRDGAIVCRQRRHKVGCVARRRKQGYLATVWDVWKEALEEAVACKQQKQMAREQLRELRVKLAQQRELRMQAHSRAMAHELSEAFSNFVRGLHIIRAQHRLRRAAGVLAASAYTFKLLSTSFRGLVVRSRQQADLCVDRMVFSLLRQRALRRHWKALRHGIRLCQLSEYHEEHRSIPVRDSTEALCHFSLWKMHVKNTVQTQLRVPLPQCILVVSCMNTGSLTNLGFDVQRRMDTFYVH